MYFFYYYLELKIVFFKKTVGSDFTNISLQDTMLILEAYCNSFCIHSLSLFWAALICFVCRPKLSKSRTPDLILMFAPCHIIPPMRQAGHLRKQQASSSNRLIIAFCQMTHPARKYALSLSLWYVRLPLSVPRKHGEYSWCVDVCVPAFLYAICLDRIKKGPSNVIFIKPDGQDNSYLLPVISDSISSPVWQMIQLKSARDELTVCVSTEGWISKRYGSGDRIVHPLGMGD